MKRKRTITQDSGLLASATAELWKTLGISALALPNPSVLFLLEQKKNNYSKMPLDLGHS